MKGDFSRATFDAKKHYSGVLMQQGRVQTDADWNEQEAIQRRRTQVEARDVIGRCGAPKDDAGFAIAISAGKLTIGAGRYYVDGILCENETEDLAFDAQPDGAGAPDWAELLAKAKAANALVYLDVWERHITPLDDPLLREVALGGPDTATRVKTVWQVRVLPTAVTRDPAKLGQLQATRAKLLKKREEMVAAGANPQEIAALDAELAKADKEIAAIGAAPTCDDAFPEWDALVADPDRRMNARAQAPPPATGPCIVPPTAGYRRLENQLYRVEVHTAGAPGTATFKWSRDNGTVVTAIEKISGNKVTVHDLGPDDVLGFASNQWVELSDDRLELDGKPGQLVQIDTVSSSLRQITLKSAPAPLASGADGVDRSLHPKLRRWDQTGSTATASGVAMTGAWLALEDGVEVQFQTADYRTGDYWVIPARTATGEIEWPPYEIPNTAPLPQPRRGIHHHFCRLALISFDAEKKAWSVADDCRTLFPPLTEPCCDAKALRVVGTNWANDDAFSSAVLTREGLRITVDAAPDAASLTNDTVQVAIEVPFVQGQTPVPNVAQRVYIRGEVGRDPADPKVIVWRPQVARVTDGGVVVGPSRAVRKTARERPRAARAARDTEVTAAGALAGPTAQRVRVVLKGHCIWSESGGARDARERRAAADTRLFLDGQCFGRPGLRADGTTPRIDLAFPSGRADAASDFESWFFLGATPTRRPLQVSLIRFIAATGAPSSAGDVKPPLGPNQSVIFKAGERVVQVEITFNRAVEPKSVGTAAAPSITIEQIGGRNERKPLAVDLQPDGEVVRVRLRDPAVFEAGNFVLTCVGTPRPETKVPGLEAADDGSQLDGDYDEEAGGDLAVPFTAT